jgi:ribosome biogenesis GTPase A
MARAEICLRQDIKIVDLVVELLDARIPSSSSNPSFPKLIGSKKHLILLHKADRAEEDVTKLWLKYFKNSGKPAMAFSVYNKVYLNNLLNYLGKEENNIKKGRLNRPLRMIIAGIPNVGKSTMINYFVKKSVTRTGNQPGVTRGRQWIRINPRLELLDTPGMLWPRIDRDSVWPLAMVGAIPHSRVDIQQTARRLLSYYVEHGKESFLLKRYQGLEIGDTDTMLAGIGSINGCILPGGKIDYDRSAAVLLRDFQSGGLGRATLEHPSI